MNIEHFLKNSINIEKEAWAAAEAMENLALRKDANALLEEYAQDLTYMEEVAMMVVKMVGSLPDEDVKRVFVARYLHKMTWEEAANAVFLSVAQAQRLHKKGIAWLEENFQS